MGCQWVVGCLPSCQELIRADSRRMQIRSTCAGQKPAVSQGAAETNATDFGGALGEKLSKSDKIYIQNAIEIILITHHDVRIAQAEQEIFGKDRSRCKTILSAAKCFPLSFFLKLAPVKYILI